MTIQEKDVKHNNVKEYAFMREKLMRLNQQRDDIISAMDELRATVEREDRDYTTDEDRKLDSLQSQLKSVDRQIVSEKAMLNCNGRQLSQQDAATIITERAEAAAGVRRGASVLPVGADGPELWTDQNNKFYYALAPRHSLFDHPNTSVSLPAGCTRQNLRGSFGRILRARVTGNWRGAEFEREIMASGSTTDNATGGYLAPNPVANWVIDLARAQSVLVRAGARTLPFDASDLRIARVSSDPTVQVKGENDAFSDLGPAFDSVLLVARTIGCYATFSRELIADAPNAPEIIENTFVRALANKWDYYGIQGQLTAGAEPAGVLTMAQANVVESVGDPTWADWLTAMKELMADNEEPLATIYSPACWLDLQSLLVNSETNHYATMPEPVAKLAHFPTTQCPNDYAVVGDFREMLIGIRQDISVEVTTTGGDTFSKHQVAMKAVMRGDFALTRRTAFCRLSGIS